MSAPLRSAVRLSLALTLATAAHSVAMAGQDALYHYRPSTELPTLRAYHQQPYWRGLAECAGMHGNMMNRYQAAGNTAAAAASRERAVALLQQANSRLQADRGINSAAALALTEPVVSAGRASADVLFSTPLPWARSYTTEQIVDSMCGQLADRAANPERGVRAVSAPR